MEAVLILIGAIVLIPISILMIFSRKEAKDYFNYAAEEHRNELSSGRIPGFTASRTVENTRDFVSDSYFALTIDHEHDEMCYCNGTKKVFFSFSNIISADLLIDDLVTVSEKSVSIGKAIVGGVVAGAAGAIIGGTSGKSYTSRIVSSIKIHILLRNTEPSVIDISFLPGPTEMYQCKEKIAREMMDLFKIALDKVRTRNVPVMETNTLSAAQELEKLASLYERGLITQEEFAAMKLRVLQK